MDLRSPRTRLLIVAALAAIWTGAAVGRLAYLQLFRYSEYYSRAQHQQRLIVEVGASRAGIFDRNMNPLAMSVPVDSAFAVPSEIADPDMVARLIGKVLDVPPDEIATRLAASHSFAWIARKLPPDKAERIAAMNLRGIYFQREGGRFYPKRELAAHVLGYVDIDEKGLGGIEYSLDDHIRSKPGKMLILADAHRRWYDSDRQGAGHRHQRRAHARRKYSVHRGEGTCAGDSRHAGDVGHRHRRKSELRRTAGSGELADVQSERRQRQPSRCAHGPRRKLAVRARVGFQDRDSLRGHRSGSRQARLILIDCQKGAIYIAGHRIRDHKAYGDLSVSQILANSSDVGAIKIGLRLGAPKFYDYIRAFGFGQSTGVDLPGESRGMLRRLANWTPVSVGSISMGQEVGVTPLQMVNAVSAIANGGLIVRPHVVRALRHGTQLVEPQEPEPRRVIQETTAATMRRMLEGVVLNGTGKLARIDGYTTAGKTGTAQKFDINTGHYFAHKLIASFVGFAPINTPAVTILVQLDSPVGPHDGGEVAAPVFQRIAQQILPYLNVPQDVPLLMDTLRAGRTPAGQQDLAEVSDFDPAQADSITAEEDPVPTAVSGADAPTVELAEGQGIPAPQLRGKTVREVTEQCIRMGLNPVLVGSGIASDQSPEPGAMIRRGSRITVQFARDVSLMLADSRRKIR